MNVIIKLSNLPGIKRFFRHLLAWTTFIIANALLFSIGRQGIYFREFLTDYLLSIPIILFLSYTTAYLLIPSLLLKNKILLFVLSFLAVLGISGLMENFKTQYILTQLVRKGVAYSEPLGFVRIFNMTFFILIPTIYFITIKYSRDWYNMKVLKAGEESKHLQNELQYLKSQVHPYFLLITLSNLENIARIDPKKAAPGIEKISEILSFILYGCNFQYIRLNTEIDQIQRFVEIQELNFPDMLKINYSVIGNASNTNIAPLMLFTIIEFFFKKTNPSPSEPMKINIFIEIIHNILNCSIQSENFPISGQDYYEDAGISNLRKRIEIIYGTNGSLMFREFGNKFMIQLNLKNIDTHDLQ